MSYTNRPGQVIELDEPREILNKIEKLKRDEINDTTVSIQDQFRLLTFKLGNESVHDFNLHFDELVRHYNIVNPTKMSRHDEMPITN